MGTVAAYVSYASPVRGITPLMSCPLGTCHKYETCTKHCKKPQEQRSDVQPRWVFGVGEAPGLRCSREMACAPACAGGRNDASDFIFPQILMGEAGSLEMSHHWNFSDSCHQKKSLKEVRGPSTQYFKLAVERGDPPSPNSQSFTLPKKTLGGSQPSACNYHSLQSWPPPPHITSFFFSFFPFTSKPGKASDVGSTATSWWGKAAEGISRIIKRSPHRP